MFNKVKNMFYMFNFYDSDDESESEEEDDPYGGKAMEKRVM